MADGGPCVVAEAVPVPLDSEKYKTELCRNWLQEGVCRFGKPAPLPPGPPGRRARAAVHEK